MSRNITVYTRYYGYSLTRMAIRKMVGGGRRWPFRVVWRWRDGPWRAASPGLNWHDRILTDDTAEAIAWLLEGEKGGR